MIKLLLLFIPFSSFAQFSIDRIAYDPVGGNDTLWTRNASNKDSLFRRVEGSFSFAVIPRLRRMWRSEDISDATAFLSSTGNGSSLTGITKSQVGLSNVDNTADVSKPVSTATQTALNAKQYSINVQALTSSPADAQTIYFGALPKAPVGAAATSRIHIRKTGVIEIANIYCFSGTAGTAESWSLYVRLNNTTDFLIATVAAATSERVFSNTGLSISVVAGDYVEIKSVNPTWVTNPLTTIFGGYILIR